MARRKKPLLHPLPWLHPLLLLLLLSQLLLPLPTLLLPQPLPLLPTLLLLLTLPRLLLTPLLPLQRAHLLPSKRILRAA